MSSAENKTLQAQSSITMTILLVSFSMLFGTLVLGYSVYRARAAVWPPMGMTLPGLLAPTLSTVFIGLSSLTYFLMEAGLDKKAPKKLYFWLTEIFIIGFALGQLNLWGELSKNGINADSGIFGSMLYGFTWIHAAHILIGFILVSSVYKLIGKDSGHTIKEVLRVKNIGLFWHFLGLMWLVLYLLLFIF